jgi:predicted Zn-ribbon and HTH transcriptional regulator
MTAAEAYAKLKPPAPTPPAELCTCAKKPPIKLIPGPGFNPMSCTECGLEVSPESLKLTAELAEAVAHWNAAAEGIYRLWLSGGEYENWGGRQLADLVSPINVDGRRLAGELNAVRRCYFWFFGDEDGATECPRCHSALTAMSSASGPLAFCDDCSLIGQGAA